MCCQYIFEYIHQSVYSHPPIYMAIYFLYSREKLEYILRILASHLDHSCYC